MINLELIVNPDIIPDQMIVIASYLRIPNGRRQYSFTHIFFTHIFAHMTHAHILLNGLPSLIIILFEVGTFVST